MKEKGFSKVFILVVIGQVISLFGNGILRFALPIHLLSVTGSAKILGLVSGFAFLPLALLSPIGGLIADRVNKRNIMVALDFFTAFLSLLFIFLYGQISIVTLILVMLFLLYGISGAYQPSVQASVPVLVGEKKIMTANAVINMVSSLSGLLGPALGGMAYAVWGIIPVLYVSAGCFAFSAVMEIFIKIPFQKKTRKGSLLAEASHDMRESLSYICRIKPEIGKITICCSLVNLVLSALLIIGLPVVVMEYLVFPRGVSPSQLYGYMEAVLGLGGILGGLAVGVLGSRLKFSGSWKVLLMAPIALVPMGLALELDTGYLAYGILAVCGLLAMAASSAYSIQAMAFVQVTTPPDLIGKVISWILMLTTCAMPIGQVFYGYLFEICASKLSLLFFGAAAISAALCLYNRKVVKDLS